MIPISEKSSGGALVDWVPEGHDRKYTEPAAMSIRIAATPSAWAFDFCTSDWTVEEPNSSSGCLSRLGPLRAGRQFGKAREDSADRRGHRRIGVKAYFAVFLAPDEAHR